MLSDGLFWRGLVKGSNHFWRISWASDDTAHSPPVSQQYKWDGNVSVWSCCYEIYPNRVLLSPVLVCTVTLHWNFSLQWMDCAPVLWAYLRCLIYNGDSRTQDRCRRGWQWLNECSSLRWDFVWECAFEPRLNQWYYVSSSFVFYRMRRKLEVPDLRCNGTPIEKSSPRKTTPFLNFTLRENVVFFRYDPLSDRGPIFLCNEIHPLFPLKTSDTLILVNASFPFWSTWLSAPLT